MGVGFAHGTDDDFGLIGPSWTYSGFMRFRRALAKAEGLNLDDMEGYADHRLGRLMREGETPVPEQAITWDSVSTPLEPLLNHSDCDGELTPEECKQVAPRLKEIASGSFDDLPESHEKRRALDLVAAMEYCAEHGENLRFC
jgi:hypothetical protein